MSKNLISVHTILNHTARDPAVLSALRDFCNAAINAADQTRVKGHLVHVVHKRSISLDLVDDACTELAALVETNGLNASAQA